MIWILILHINKQNKRLYFQNKCIKKIKLKSKNGINLKQNKFYLPKKKHNENMKKTKKISKQMNFFFYLNLTRGWLLLQGPNSSTSIRNLVGSTY
jgi:hypothetical protein